MKVSLWAEIRRLHEIERLSQRAIARRLHCTRRSVSKALALDAPATQTSRPRRSLLQHYQPRIAALIAQYPELSAVRVHEEISGGPDAYPGSISLVRRYLRRIRPVRGRVYQEVYYEPGEAMQVDWGDCGRILVGQTHRRVSVFVAVLCYSRIIYIAFSLSQRKADFYRCLVHALQFWQGSPRNLIFDNLKPAVLNGSGRHACLHPEFLALCGHFCMQPVACERRDPQSKGVVEAGVRYIKRNALQGRADQLVCWNDYLQFAPYWRDQVANVRIHETTKQRPVDRFQSERPRLRPLPAIPYDSDEIVSAIVTPHARVRYDANRYSVPPQFVRKPVMLRVSETELRVLHDGQQISRHIRCFEKGRILCLPEHQLATRSLRKRSRANQVEQEFDSLGAEARQFRLMLLKRPIKTTVHLRRLLALRRVYGHSDVLQAIRLANQFQTYDAAYVETLLYQERRRRQLPSPIPLCPKRRELIEQVQLDESDPALYDRLWNLDAKEPL